MKNASRSNNKDSYSKYVEACDEMSKLCTLRGQMGFNYAGEPLHIEEVEPAVNIVKRFCTGEMAGN